MRRNILVDTHAEPSSLLAIKGIVKTAACPLRVVVCVGEGDWPGRKVEPMRDFLRALQAEYPKTLLHYEVLQGLGSDSKYPYDTQRPVDYGVDIYRHKLALMLSDEYYMFKPPREILGYMPELEPRKGPKAFVLGNRHFCKVDLATESVREFLDLFQRVLYYESNKIYGTQFAYLFRPVVESESNKMITDLITRWNSAFIREWAGKEASAPTEVAAILSTIKIATSCYVVMREAGVFCTNPNMTVRLREFHPVPQWDEDPDGHVCVFFWHMPVMRRIVVAEQLDLF